MADEHPDYADIEASLKRAEMEETARVCTYIEMPYSNAKTLMDIADKYNKNEGDFESALVLIDFALQFCDSLLTAVEEHMDDD